MQRIAAAVIALALCGCATAFRAWEGVLYVPSLLIVGPMSRLIAKPCPGSIAWDGTAGSPCRSQMLREPSVEVSWSWRPSTPSESPRTVYARNCAGCHDRPERAPDLRASEFVDRSTASDLTFFLMMGRPTKGMPAWGGGRLPMTQIEDVAKYLKNQQ